MGSTPDRELRFGVGAIPGDYRSFTEWARCVERSGFDVIGTGDSSTLWADPFVTLTLAATVTERIGLAVIGTNPVTRHPVASAAAIASVQAISGGRCSYVLGSGDSAVANIGRGRARLAELEEYGRAVQRLAAGAPCTYRGVEMRMRWSSSCVPVHLCAEGPRTQRLAGRFADGAMLYNGVTRDVVDASVANVAAGAAEAGRSIDDVELWWPVVFVLSDDRDAGVDLARVSLAATANRAFRTALAEKLVPPELHDGFRGLQREYRSSHHQQAAASWNGALLDKYGLTEYLVERFAIVGPAHHCVDRLRELASWGVRNVTLSIPSLSLPEQLELLERIQDEVLRPVRGR